MIGVLLLASCAADPGSVSGNVRGRASGEGRGARAASSEMPSGKGNLPGSPTGKGRRHDRERPLERVDVGTDTKGELRSFYLHVPANGTKPMPALFLFHGGVGNDGRDMAKNWMEQLDQGMILVFPNGQLTRPDVGGFVTEKPGERFQVENVERIVEKVVRDYGADPNRLYAAGFSGGAEMADQLACTSPNTFRAYGHIGRTILQDQLDDCAAGTDRPQIMLLGTADDRAPPEGKKEPDGSWRQVPATVAWDFWLKRAGCGEKPSTVETLPDRGDAAKIVVSTWTGCQHAAGMRYVSMEGVGHTWPGGPEGREVKDIDASETFLSFFREYAAL